MKSKYEDLFETSIGKEFDVRLNDLNKRLLQIKKSYEKTYSKEVEIARKEIKHDNSLKFLNMKIAELTAKRNKSIRDDEEIKNISSKIESLRVEREDAKKEFVRLNKQKSSNNWKIGYSNCCTTSFGTLGKKSKWYDRSIYSKRSLRG